MSVTIDTTEVLGVINAIISRIEDPVPLYDMVGLYSEERIKQRIQHLKMSPDGVPWAPWRAMTEDIRDWKGNWSQGLLWDEGHLLHSIHAEIDGAFEVSIGTDVYYAQDLQEGIMGKMEARPFIGFEEGDDLMIADAARLYFETGILKGLHHG